MQAEGPTPSLRLPELQFWSSPDIPNRRFTNCLLHFMPLTGTPFIDFFDPSP